MATKEKGLAKYREDYEACWANYQMFCDWEEKKPTIFGFFCGLLRYKVWPRLIERTVCRWYGHNIEIDGEGTPDYGYEDWECKRCGIGGRIRYY